MLLYVKQTFATKKGFFNTQNKKVVLIHILICKETGKPKPYK